MLKLENQFEIQKFGCFFISWSDSHLLVIEFFFFFFPFLDLIWFVASDLLSCLKKHFTHTSIALHCVGSSLGWMGVSEFWERVSFDPCGVLFFTFSVLE